MATDEERDMPSRRASYLPITTVVVTIVVLAAVVGVISYRDIERGRAYVAEVLRHRATGLLMTVGADVRAELGSPDWQPGRIDAFFEEVVAAREGVDYIALLDGAGKTLIHSDPSQVGSFWPDFPELLEDPEERFFDPRRRPQIRSPWGGGESAFGSRTVNRDGRRTNEYAFAVDIPAVREAHDWLRRAGRGRPHRGLDAVPEIREEAFLTRLSDLLGHPVDADSRYRLVTVVGLDPTDLEAGAHVSRNYTIMLAGILLFVGAVAVYFLAATAHHRSTRIALANMQSYTRNIIESMTTALVSSDSYGRIATVNPGACLLLRSNEPDLVGRGLRDTVRLVPEKESAAVDRVVAGELPKYEAEARLIAGESEVPVAVSASLLRDEDGTRTGAVVLLQDAVEREKHLAALGRLAAGVAHEVRNPLSSLKGFAQFFRSKFRPGSEEERYSDIMIEEVERLDRVVQELLDFAKPTSPDRVLSDPNELVDQVLALVVEDAQFREVAIERRFASRLPQVFVDPLQIRQALLNLLLNGIEAMEGGGTLTLETSISTEARSVPFVSVDISDTGEGMTPDEIAKLFEPFYTTKPKGTGLGLTIVSRILEQNGGRITVKSVKGEGTTFSALLPIAAHERVAMDGDGGRPGGS